MRAPLPYPHLSARISYELAAINPAKGIRLWSRTKLPSTRTKIKTKGEAQSNFSLPSPTSEPIEGKIRPFIALEKRAFEDFETLFFSPNQNDFPGEVAWQELLFAMGATGFTMQKLHVSIWQFWPPKSMEAGATGIQFHEPHPKGKISFLKARRFGRRLFQAYGWSIETFMLK